MIQIKFCQFPCCIKTPLKGLLLCCLLLTGCGSGGGSGDDSGNDSTSGILFEGDPTALTITIIVDYDSGDRTTQDEISIDSDGVEIDRTNIEIVLVDTATTGEVNTLLESIGGKIVSMIEGVNIILVQIPDPGDLAGLALVIATIEVSPLVDWVRQAEMSGTDSLPGNYFPETTNLNAIDHHLAVLAPAAWNARAALSYPAMGAPLILQSDYFGSGVPDADFDINVLDATDFFSLAPKANRHGYHVLGIMSGRHTTNSAAGTTRDLVTGMYPGTIDLRVVDRSAFNAPKSENQIVKIIRSSGRRVVLNTSLHSGCPRPPQQACVLPKAKGWLRKLRGDIAYFSGKKGVWEDDFLLHMTSAGNFKIKDPDGNVLSPPDDKGAALNSQYTAAFLVTGLTNSKRVAVPNVTNMIVVENRVNDPVPYTPGCLAASSKKSGDLSGIGNRVWSFTDWSTEAGALTGTSMSTPQVAALGAYVWALKPTLKPADVINILKTTAGTYTRDSACADVPSAVIDAYAAVLAVDDAKAIDPMFANPMDAPVRLAILDVVGDGGSAGANRIFDEADLSVFADAFRVSGGRDRDYSRFDLNGDSYTGGNETGLLNLDIDAAQNYGAVSQDVEGKEVIYDESRVTDQEILCYYAYSPLYTGSAEARTAVMAPICGLSAMLIISSRGGDNDVYSMSPDGSNLINLTNDSLNYLSASISPNGTKIASRSSLDNGDGTYTLKINIMDADGANQISISSSDVDIRAFFTIFFFGDQLTWSADGSQIAFPQAVELSPATDTEAAVYTYNIFVINADGANEHNLADSLSENVANLSPSWSPDGAKIIYVHFTNTPAVEEIPAFTIGNIFMMNADGSGEQNITDNTIEDHGFLSPRFSPDGTKIAYIANSISTGGVDLYVMNVDGSNRVNLTNDAALAAVFPVWSPDGSKIAFTSAIDANYEIYVIDVDGSNLVNISNDPAFDLAASWQ